MYRPFSPVTLKHSRVATAASPLTDQPVHKLLIRGHGNQLQQTPVLDMVLCMQRILEMRASLSERVEMSRILLRRVLDVHHVYIGEPCHAVDPLNFSGTPSGFSAVRRTARILPPRVLGILQFLQPPSWRS